MKQDIIHSSSCRRRSLTIFSVVFYTHSIFGEALTFAKYLTVNSQLFSTSPKQRNSLQTINGKSCLQQSFHQAGERESFFLHDTEDFLKEVDKNYVFRDSHFNQYQQIQENSKLSILFNENDHKGKNRRIFLSSLLLGTSVFLGIEGPANAAELTWAASPVNKRSGVTVFQAEKNGYNVRFITYLSRFLISFDEECQRWWFARAADIPRFSDTEEVDMMRLKQFGAFSASVEVGLQEYEGPDGPKDLMVALLKRYCPDIEDIRVSREMRNLPPLKPAEEEKKESEIKESRRQIALLFGLLEANQPVEQITKNLAGIDNAFIQNVTILNPGSGYAPGYGAPAVRFPPPLAGDNYEVATGRAILQPNGRILRVDLKQRGFGYTKPPTVTITAPIAEAFGAPVTEASAATAKSYIYRNGINKGRIARIQVLTQGKGYTDDEPVKVIISPPDIPQSEGGEVAKANVVLEYEVGEIEIVNTGAGYAAEKPLEIYVDPPPLTARVNLNDPMMVKFITAQDLSTKNSKGMAVYDPSVFSAKIWSQAKIGGGGGCVGRACYDTPVQAVAYAKAKSDSYTSYRNYEETVRKQEIEEALGKRSAASLKIKKKKKVKGTTSGENDAMPVMPFWSGGGVSSSRQLLTLLPSGVGLEYNQELRRYVLALGRDIDDLTWSTLPAGKPINPDFGPRGRSPIEREKDLDESTFLRFVLSGAVCCSSVHLALTPLDVMKTKVQTDPQKHTDFVTSFKILSKEGGFSSFFVGWVPTFLGFFVNGGIAYSVTEFFRRYFSSIVGDTAANFEVLIILAAASSSAFIGAFLLAPFESIRIRCVAQPDYAPNPFEVTKRIVVEEGAGSLFAAIPIFLVKEIPFAMAKFTVFDLSTAWLYDQFPAAREDLQLSLLVSLVGGTLGGMSAAVVSNPADATISEMKKSRSDLGPIGSVRTVLNRDGTLGLFRGLDIRLFFYALLVSLQFLLYDAVRFSLGIGSDDMKLFLDVLGGALRESGGPV